MATLPADNINVTTAFRQGQLRRRLLLAAPPLESTGQAVGPGEPIPPWQMEDAGNELLQNPQGISATRNSIFLQMRRGTNDCCERRQPDCRGPSRL
ncbi:hypothetical protein AC579_767 [Pseudocercospora musae]|uniref:Uncharacterized protein n=1 Tax=Pseudocercospora musae TaxID=113226 RepID=A0A139IJE3_9PEZI|nr:hypothetical protein AC579_767 [Pseudocercospora musae]